MIAVRAKGGDPKGKPSASWPGYPFVPSSPEQLFARQMFQESKFDPKAVSPAGARGIAQFMPITQRHMHENFGYPKDWDVEDPQLARRAQEEFMFSLYQQPWNKGNEENKWVKALAAYNYGSGNTKKLLEKLKAEGVDIYESTDWIERLPEETYKYVKQILYGFPDDLALQYKEMLPKYVELYPQRAEYLGFGKPKTQSPKVIKDDTPSKRENRTISPELENAFKILRRDNFEHGGRHGDPVKGITDYVSNSVLGRLFGMSDFDDDIPRNLRGGQDRYRVVSDGTMPSVQDLDPAGLPSTFDALFEFTPADDLTQLISSAASASEGKYLEAALAPLFMFLPGPLAQRLRSKIGEMRMAKARFNTPEGKAPAAIMRDMRTLQGELDVLAAEAYQLRKADPLAYDQAMREVAEQADMIGYNPFRQVQVDDLAADAFISGRQRNLGYTGRVPSQKELSTSSPRILEGEAITTGDPLGLRVVGGTPSERVRDAALLHQTHGSAANTGIFPSSEMQHLTEDVTLTRVPIPGKAYRVVRDGQEQLVKAGQIEEGDIILSLSQKSGGQFGGSNRIVSTSAADLPSIQAAFGNPEIDMNIDAMHDAGIIDDEMADMLLMTGEDPTNYVDAMMMGPVSTFDPNRPSFKIINTKGMPVTRADLMKPGGGTGSSRFTGEDEFGVSARQAFDVLETGLQEEGVPFMLLAPKSGGRFKYVKGGKFKVIKK